MNGEGRFVKVVCSRCKNKQVVFGKSSTIVRCLKCGKRLAKNRGGKVRIRTFVMEVFRR